MSDKTSLLVIDDETRVLDVLVKTFEEEYTVYSAHTAFDALDILRDNPISVVLTDEKMPKFTGMNFLKEAKKIRTTVNIILTAYADISIAIDAINSGLVYRYLIKPWDTDELKLAIRQASEKFKLLTENKLLSVELIDKNRKLEENIAHLKMTQDKLLHNEKLATVGQLTASIGHELRNPLSRIKASAALLKQDFQNQSKEVDELFQIIDNEVLISNKIIGDLLDFSRDRKPVFKLDSYNDVILATLARMRIPENVVVSRDLSEGLPDNMMDSGQIQQVLINLFMNAVQAMEHGGKLTIQTSFDSMSSTVEVKDTGLGISHQNLERMFEPLFSTKPKGIGLGMSIVKMLVEKHQGSISIQSRENIGTTVKLNFPFITR